MAISVETKTVRVTPIVPRWARGHSLRNAGPVFALVALAAGFQVASGAFLTVSNLQSVVEAAAVPALLAAGISFVLILGAIDLSLQGVMATCSLVVALLVANNVNHNDFGAMGVLVTLLVATVFGLTNGLLNTIARIPSLIATLGTWFIGLGIANVLFPDRVPRIRDAALQSLADTRVFGFSLVVYLVLAILGISAWTLRFTTFGRMIYAIGGDESIVLTSGLPVRRYKIAAFTISGTFAGLAGILLSAQLGNGSVTVGDGMLFSAISGAVVGGTLLTGGQGGVIQSALGALVLEVLNNGLILVDAGPYVRQAISGTVIVAVVATTGWRLRSKLRVVK